MEEDSCRICLLKTQPTTRQNLFLEDSSNLSAVGELYEMILNIPIVFSENFTLKYICSTCDLQLKLFNQLKDKALESYLFLSNLSKCPLRNDDSNVRIEEQKLIEPEVHSNENDIDRDFRENEKNISEYIDHENNECNEKPANEPEDGISDDDFIENLLNSVVSKDYQNEDNMVDDNILEAAEAEELPNEEQAYLINQEEEPFDNVSDEGNYEAVYLDDDFISESLESQDENCPIKEENIDEDDNKPTEELIEANENFECMDCHQLFKLKTRLKYHRKKFHPPSFQKVACTQCGKVLFSKETFQAHMNIHNGLPAYQCEICDKGFKQKVHLTYHMLKHKNERNEICYICEKAFFSKEDLKAHMRSHTDERRFKCDICEKAFRLKIHLVDHRYTHFEKQFECPACFQKYISPNTLRTHIKAVHSKEVPFECELCEKKFKRKHHLQAHYKTHSKDFKDIILMEP